VTSVKIYDPGQRYTLTRSCWLLAQRSNRLKS